MKSNNPLPNSSPPLPGNPKKHRRLLRWEDTCSLAEVCDLPALTRAANLLGLGMEPSPTQGDASHNISLAPGKASHLLTIRGSRISVAEPERISHYLTVTIPWTFFYLSPQPVLHAASCVVDDQAVLFCGWPEAGKSSLAAAAWQRGLPVINDDCTAIDPARALVRPFPQCLSLRLSEPVVPEPFARALGESDQYFLGKNWKSDCWVLFGRSLPGMVAYGMNFPVRGLYLVKRGAHTRRTPADRQSALRKILAQTYPGQAGKLALLPFIESLMSQGKIHELEVGDGDVSGALSLAISPS